jgi:hypothetical protein
LRRAAAGWIEHFRLTIKGRPAAAALQRNADPLRYRTRGAAPHIKDASSQTSRSVPAARIPCPLAAALLWRQPFVAVVAAASE